MIDRHHETVLPPNPPTPEQLHALTSVGFGSASSRNRLKHLKPRPNEPESKAHYFVEELDLLPIYEEEVEIRNMRHRMAGRVGVRGFDLTTGQPKVWSLKFFDTAWVEQAPNVWLAQRTLYKFEWTRTRAIMSERTTRVIGDGAIQMGDIYDAIDNFRISDSELAVWHAQSEFETVTTDDVALLTSDAERYFGMVDQVSAHAA